MVPVKRPICAGASLSLVNDSSKQDPRYRAFLLPLVLVLAVAPMPALEVLTKVADDLHAFAVIDGVERPTHVGDTVAQGQLVGSGTDQFCELPETTFGLAGSSSGQARITLQITSDCRLVVTSIDVLRNEPERTLPESDSMKAYPAGSTGVRDFETKGPHAE